jgi:hypothetical protein
MNQPHTACLFLPAARQDRSQRHLEIKHPLTNPCSLSRQQILQRELHCKLPQCGVPAAVPSWPRLGIRHGCIANSITIIDWPLFCHHDRLLPDCPTFKLPSPLSCRLLHMTENIKHTREQIVGPTTPYCPTCQRTAPRAPFAQGLDGNRLPNINNE